MAIYINKCKSLTALNSLAYFAKSKFNTNKTEQSASWAVKRLKDCKNQDPNYDQKHNKYSKDILNVKYAQFKKSFPFFAAQFKKFVNSSS